MNRTARLFALAFCLCALPLAVAAQVAAPTPKKTTKTTAPRVAELDPLAEARRTSALALVNSLADEARSFRDQSLRARVQARVADALWETDKERARSLFRRAWEAAETADAENARLTQEERRARQAARGSSASPGVPSVRPEVLRLAARRDRALGEEFLARLDESRKQEASNATSNPQPPPVDSASGARFNPDNPPPLITQRLRLADQLLEDGSVESALQFADPALYPINVYGVAFLDQLRTKNAAAANERYAALLTRAANDPSADANSVSLLSAYVLTPFLYVSFGPNGESHTRRRQENNTPPADLPLPLREAFLRAASAVLLRPLPPPDQDRTSTGRGGTYMVIARLAPIFEQYAPDVAPALRARLAVLQPDTPEGNRQPNSPVLTRGLTPEDKSVDRVQESLDRLSNAQTSEERDQIYLNAFLASLRQDNPARSRELADKIEDLDTRKQARAFLAFNEIEDGIRAKNAEATLRVARSEDLTPVQHTWGLTEAARMLSKSDAGRALEILESALVEARKIDAASPDRARALVAIATQLFALDKARAWETMGEVVRAANAASEFSGEDGGLTMIMQLKHGASTTNFNVEGFDLNNIFALLAKDDFNRATSLAKTFNAESPRSVATLVIARTALEGQKKKKTVANSVSTSNETR
jgi:hypothetical protein